MILIRSNYTLDYNLYVITSGELLSLPWFSNEHHPHSDCNVFKLYLVWFSISHPFKLCSSSAKHSPFCFFTHNTNAWWFSISCITACLFLFQYELSWGVLRMYLMYNSPNQFSSNFALVEAYIECCSWGCATSTHPFSVGVDDIFSETIPLV